MPRFLGANPVRHNRFRAAALLAAGALATIGLAATGSGAVGGPTTAPARADDSTLTLNGPTGSGVSVSVTPKDLTTVKQGDTVHLHFSGLKQNGDSVLVGTCPSDLPLSQIDFATFGSTASQQACLAKFPTGLTGDLDPNSPNNPGLSTDVFRANPRADGTVDVDYLVGSGDSVGTPAYTLFLKNGDQKTVDSLTCDGTHACVVGFEVTIGKKPFAWRDLTTLKITPAANSSDDTGCEGISSKSTINAVGPERMQYPVAGLNGGYCSGTKSALPVSYVPSAGGEDDPTGISQVGSGTTMALAGSPLLAKHPLTAGQVAVPLALNSVELAQWGGTSQPSISSTQLAYNADPLPPLALQPADVAGIVLHDYPTLWPGTLPTKLAGGKKLNPLAAAILSRPGNQAALKNFDPSLIGLPMLNAPTVTYSLGNDSTAIALSSFLAAKAPSAWTFPTNDINNDLKRSGKAVGPVEAYSDITDETQNGSKLTSQTSSTSGLFSAKFSKDLTSGTQTYLCPMVTLPPGISWQLALTKGCARFGVMDSATANALSFTGAKINDGSAYVGPTTASLTAAATGTLNSDGYYDATSATAYPLTYVEYAVVPTAPLLDSKCRPLTAEQAQLKAFLQYAVAGGQSTLPAGLAPLSSDLVSQATAAIAKLGTGSPTGTCAATTTTPTATATTGTTSSSGGGNTGGVTSTGGNIPSGNGATAPASTTSTAPPNSVTALPKTQEVSNTIPGFGKMAKVSSAGVLIGLLLLTGLVSAAAVGVANGVGPKQLLARARSMVSRRPA